MKTTYLRFVFVLAVGFITACSQTSAPPMQEALDAMISDGEVEVSEVVVDGWDTPSDRYFLFSPVGVTPTTGFIIYPGGAVDPRGYAPTARAIAAEGYLVAIVSMPMDLAILGYKRGSSVVGDFPDIEYWAIGGHSLGGTGASAYARQKSLKTPMDGVVFWASYPSGPFLLSNRIMQVTSIYGTNDGLSTVKTVEGSAVHLPPDTQWHKIEGGNHTYFGWYGDGESLQSGDKPADMSREEQQEIIIDHTVDFLAGLTPGPFTDAQTNWCEDAQSSLAGYTPGVLSDTYVSNKIHLTLNSIIDSKPSVSAEALRVHTFFAEDPAVALGYEQIWCKTKTAAAIEKASGIAADVEGQTCADLNQAAIDYALDQVAPATRDLFLSTVSVDYLEDSAQSTGDAWVNANLSLLAVSENNYTLESPSLRTSTSVPLVGGMHYCKLLSPEGAVAFVESFN